jgi:ribonuclease VapC
MIVIDSSALMAVILFEPEREKFIDIISTADRCAISSVTLLEAQIVAFRRLKNAGSMQLDRFLAGVAPETVPFDDTQSALAFQAFKTYGKGIHPKARLNFGDCASYALAKSRNVPLLYNGNDFAATDIQFAVV